MSNYIQYTTKDGAIILVEMTFDLKATGERG